MRKSLVIPDKPTGRDPESILTLTALENGFWRAPE
jgi:hypothetical protein